MQYSPAPPQTLQRNRCTEQEADALLLALSSLQDKAQHLEYNLSAETRLKLDLFSALGDARRQLEIAQGSLISNYASYVYKTYIAHFFFYLGTHNILVTFRPVLDFFPPNLSSSVCFNFLMSFFTVKILKQDHEVKEMKQKLAEAIAVAPGMSYMAPRSSMPQYLKFFNSERYMLNPRALMYQCLKK